MSDAPVRFTISPAMESWIQAFGYVAMHGLLSMPFTHVIKNAIDNEAAAVEQQIRADVMNADCRSDDG